MLNRRFMVPATAALVALTFVACQDGTVAPGDVDSPQLRKQASGVAESGVAEFLGDLAADANARLAAEGLNVRTDRAFYYTASGQAGQTVFFDDRTKQLALHFVPGDPRRVGGANTDIAYMVDQVDASNLSIATTTAAINRAMGTWNGENCSTIPITTLANPAFDLGFVQGAFPAFFLGADITHAGWVGLPPGVLGVAFPFIFVSGPNPTDIDNNGKLDTAFWEIFYNVSFAWADDGVTNFDVQTVATHEAGHGLDQGHFGKLFRTDKNGKFHFAPRAVMNAGYTGPQRTLAGTDNGGHCSIWGSWPNN